MLRTAEDARRLKQRFHLARDVVVVGGGFIGLELASTARLLGKTVTVLEAAPRLMGRAVAPAISAHFLDLHRGLGSTIRLETPVAGLIGENGAVVAVETLSRRAHSGRYRDRRRRRRAQCRTRARRPGCDVANGIVVDEGDAHLRSAHRGGRRCGLVPSLGARPSGAARKRAERGRPGEDRARHLLGKPEAYRAVPWFWSDQGDAKLQMVGLSTMPTSVVRGRPEDGSFSVFHYGRRAGRDRSVNRATDHMLGRRWIGAGQTPDPVSVADKSVDLKKLAVS